MRQHLKASYNTSLSPDDVLNIRAAKLRGEDVRDVADFYDVAPSTIRKIWRGETFRHIGAPGTGPVAQREKARASWDEPTQEEREESNAMLQRLFAEQQAAENMLKEIENDAK